MWDGHTIAVSGLGASDIFHELAHWLIAPKTRRRLPEYGLGEAYDTGRKAAANNARAVSEAYAQQEEEMASLLGIAFLGVFGMNVKAALHRHGWLGGCSEHFNQASVWGTIARLNGRGLLAGNMPRALLASGLVQPTLQTARPRGRGVSL